MKLAVIPFLPFVFAALIAIRISELFGAKKWPKNRPCEKCQGESVPNEWHESLDRKDKWGNKHVHYFIFVCRKCGARYLLHDHIEASVKDDDEAQILIFGEVVHDEPDDLIDD